MSQKDTLQGEPQALMFASDKKFNGMASRYRYDSATPGCVRRMGDQEYEDEQDRQQQKRENHESLGNFLRFKAVGHPSCRRIANWAPTLYAWYLHGTKPAHRPARTEVRMIVEVKDKAQPWLFCDLLSYILAKDGLNSAEFQQKSIAWKLNDGKEGFVYHANLIFDSALVNKQGRTNDAVCMYTGWADKVRSRCESELFDGLSDDKTMLLVTPNQAPLKLCRIGCSWQDNGEQHIELVYTEGGFLPLWPEEMDGCSWLGSRPKKLLVISLHVNPRDRNSPEVELDPLSKKNLPQNRISGKRQDDRKMAWQFLKKCLASQQQYVDIERGLWNVDLEDCTGVLKVRNLDNNMIMLHPREAKCPYLIFYFMDTRWLSDFPAAYTEVENVAKETVIGFVDNQGKEHRTTVKWNPWHAEPRHRQMVCDCCGRESAFGLGCDLATWFFRRSDTQQGQEIWFDK